MSQQAPTNLDLISDASFVSDEGKGGCSTKTKQVRFDALFSPLETEAVNTPSFVDGLPKEALTKCGKNSVGEEALTHTSLPLPATPSESLDLSVLDEPHLQQTLEALSLDAPKINSVRALQEEIIQIASRINKASQSAASTAEKLATGTCGYRGGGTCLNFAREERLYKDLLAVSLDDAEVVKAERDKAARRRRRLLAEAARLHPPKAEILPEPCPMKFFNPQLHIFQSARLDITGMTDYRPLPESLSTAHQLDAIRLDYRLCTEPGYFV
ncbi:hypothetical protein ECG_00724 [Echinococcus granulosus]|uniref:Protein phosphatase 1 regulatory subunit 35 C-terminal domain-containing protein n=1 Tax=Echinococcus granulosus TaxID=6210 RepID=W6U8G4_ECHGR|nr:hypothetical protein EGR_10404 [Echinococcus granulosus]EUB54742.1 hypothetical protein EGR_10404 [Echinococcus granulosus]KAH9287051.1 hypothetical protein ECG_00724 [Echinococcus granulosus]